MILIFHRKLYRVLSTSLAHDVAMEQTQHDKAAAFKALHEGEPFIIPNPWDAGSAKALAASGSRRSRPPAPGSRSRSGAATAEDARRGGRAVAGPRPGDEPAGLRRPRERLRPRRRGRCARRSAASRRPARSAARSRTTTRTGRIYELDARGRAGRGGVRGGPSDSTSRSSSPAGPRTTSAASTISTTRSRGSRRTSAPAPTCCTRPVCAPPSRSGAVCEATTKPVNVLAHRRADDERDRRAPARSASVSAAR